MEKGRRETKNSFRKALCTVSREHWSRKKQESDAFY
jgi:hypothetical protein